MSHPVDYSPGWKSRTVSAVEDDPITTEPASSKTINLAGNSKLVIVAKPNENVTDYSFEVWLQGGDIDAAVWGIPSDTTFADQGTSSPVVRVDVARCHLAFVRLTELVGVDGAVTFHTVTYREKMDVAS